MPKTLFRSSFFDLQLLLNYIFKTLVVVSCCCNVGKRSPGMSPPPPRSKFHLNILYYGPFLPPILPRIFWLTSPISKAVQMNSKMLVGTNLNTYCICGVAWCKDFIFIKQVTFVKNILYYGKNSSFTSM